MTIASPVCSLSKFKESKEMMNFFGMIIATVTKAVVCQTTMHYISIDNYILKDNPILDMWTNVGDAFQYGTATIKSATQCGKMENCKSFSVKKDLLR